MDAAFKTPAGRDAVLGAYRTLLDALDLPIEQLRLSTRQGETFVLAIGPKDAPPLVCLHGAQANAASFLGDLRLWSQHFRVYAIDMIGEGGFSAPVRPKLDTDAHALWLDDVLDGLGIPRAAFAGISLGGWLALDYAARRPQRVQRLALLCPAGIGRLKNFLLKALPLLLLGSWGRRRMMELVMGPPVDPATPGMPPQLPLFLDMMAKLAANIRPRMERIPSLTDAQLAALPPTLVITGGKDVLIDSADTERRLQAHAPQARTIILPEARHFIPGQSQTILDFLRAA